MKKTPQIQCAEALDRCETNCVRADIYLREVDFKTKVAKDGSLPWATAYSPDTLSYNMMLPFLVSVVEDYFRSVYVAILCQSEKKLGLLKSRRLAPEDLLLVSNGVMTIETAISRTLSFQNLGAICGHFNDLDRRIDIKTALDAKHLKSKELTSDVIARVIHARHRFVHANAIDLRYTRTKARKDCDAIRLGIMRVHSQLAYLHKWPHSVPIKKKHMRITRYLPPDEMIRVGTKGMTWGQPCK